MLPSDRDSKKTTRGTIAKSSADQKITYAGKYTVKSK